MVKPEQQEPAREILRSTRLFWEEDLAKGIPVIRMTTRRPHGFEWTPDGYRLRRWQIDLRHTMAKTNLEVVEALARAMYEAGIPQADEEDVNDAREKYAMEAPRVSGRFPEMG
jgi:hypothetical protein